MADAWLMCLLIIAVCVVAGYGLSTHHQTRTTAEARLAVGSQNLQAYQVAGFAQASEELAANYARFVNASSTTQKSLTDALGGRTAQVTSVSASPIPDSDVISVEVEATSPQTAVIAARAVAQNLADRSIKQNASQSVSALLKTFNGLSLEVARQTTINDKAQKAATVTDPTKGDVRAAETAAAKLASLTEQQTAAGVAYQSTLTSPSAQSGLKIIQDAAVLSNDRRRTQELDVLSGLLLGLVLALVVASVRGRRREVRRVRRAERAELAELAATADLSSDSLGPAVPNVIVRRAVPTQAMAGAAASGQRP